MCSPTIAVMGLTVASGLSEAYSQYQQGVAQSRYYGALAGQAEQQGAYALRIGEKQSELIQDTAKMQGKEQVLAAAEVGGAQRAALAAMGIDPSSVSAQDIATSTLTKSKLDEMAIRYNANVKSWETETQAQMENWQALEQAKQYQFAGKYAKQAGKMQAFSTLLGTATSMGLTGLQMGWFKAPTTGTTSLSSGLLTSSSPTFATLTGAANPNANLLTKVRSGLQPRYTGVGLKLF